MAKPVQRMRLGNLLAQPIAFLIPHNPLNCLPGHLIASSCPISRPVAQASLRSDVVPSEGTLGGNLTIASLGISSPSMGERMLPYFRTDDWTANTDTQLGVFIACFALFQCFPKNNRESAKNVEERHYIRWRHDELWRQQ